MSKKKPKPAAVVSHESDHLEEAEKTPAPSEASPVEASEQEQGIEHPILSHKKFDKFKGEKK